MQHAVFGQPLEGGDFRALHRRHRAGARPHRLPAYQHGARAALPQAAAEPRAVELEIVAEHVEQRCRRVDVDHLPPAVNVQCEIGHGRGQSRSAGGGNQGEAGQIPKPNDQTPIWAWVLGFGIWDLGFGVWDLGFGIWRVSDRGYLLLVPCPGVMPDALPYSLLSRQMNSIRSPPPTFRSGRSSRALNVMVTGLEKAPGSSSVNTLRRVPQLSRVNRSMVCSCSV